jgi:hypothetical protein
MNLVEMLLSQPTFHISSHNNKVQYYFLGKLNQRKYNIITPGEGCKNNDGNKSEKFLKGSV